MGKLLLKPLSRTVHYGRSKTVKGIEIQDGKSTDVTKSFLDTMVLYLNELENKNLVYEIQGFKATIQLKLEKIEKEKDEV